MTDAVVNPPYVRNGHFYSPVASSSTWSARCPGARTYVGVELREKEQIELFGELVPLFEGVPHRRYRPDNSMYGIADALVYQAFVRKLAAAPGDRGRPGSTKV